MMFVLNQPVPIPPMMTELHVGQDWAMRAQRRHMNSSIWLMSLLKMIKGGMFSGRNHMIGQTEGRYENRGTDWSTNSIQ